MTDDVQIALAEFAQDASALLARLAERLGGGQRVAPPTKSMYGPATMQLPWNERVLRQSLILHEIVEAGNSVAQATWYEIAAKYGYRGRGLAGFFRAEGHGLLGVRGNGRVYVTRHGRERLAQNADRVKAALDQQSVLAPTG